MPVRYEKQLSTAINQFLWAGGTENEQRALCIKTRGKGGLSIPHLQSRLTAIRCQWIQQMQEKQGVFSLAFQNADIKIDWENAASYHPPFPKIQKAGFVNECINDWTNKLHLLAPNWGGLLWPRLNPLKRLMTLARKKSPELIIEDAKYYSWEGYNFLDNAALTNKAAKVYSSLDSEWEKQREAVRKKICQNLNCEKWKKTAPATSKRSEQLHC
jgi:hypothetical protein